MALPVSIGDAILLSQLACRLGRAFTSGPKSAPAEFQEVQNLLYSLSKALELVETHVASTSSGIRNNGTNQAPVNPNQEESLDQGEFLDRMISGCRGTLSHLESLVDKYTDLKGKSDVELESGHWRWTREIKDNWKKVRWTTEGGDLDKLKRTLVIHID